jgi:hypothetical protein
MRSIAAAIAIAVALTIPAIQAQQSPDLKKVLYDAADAMGMLRGAQEVDRIATIRYWASGTAPINGQPSRVTGYAASVNFHVPGMRVDMTRTNGAPQRAVEVVSGKWAWNETQPGMNATPAADAANARLLQLWMLPQGVVKAATAAGTAAKTATAGGSTTLTFPIASLAADVKATLDNKHFIREVEARMGGAVYTATYADYGDWNGADYLSDVMFPKRIVQKRDGVTLLDVTVSKTNTYNPYVVMPVPENIAPAAATQTAAAPAQNPGGRGGAAPAAQANVETPRTADGHPDLNGFWGGGGGGRGGENPFDEKGNLNLAGNYRKNNPVNGERDSGVGQRFGPNFPLYKAQHWDKVDYLDINGNQTDSNFHCMPAGVPRMGAPIRILQTAKDVVFLYREKNSYRMIPTDGRPHDRINSNDQTFLGDSIGRWEGDTLVVDVVGFNEETWLAWPGYFHTNKMRVTERLTRQGNTLRYQATVDDPDVLMKPWVLDMRTLQLNTNPVTQIEDPPCIESDSVNLTTKERG